MTVGFWNKTLADTEVPLQGRTCCPGCSEFGDHTASSWHSHQGFPTLLPYPGRHTSSHPTGGKLMAFLVYFRSPWDSSDWGPVCSRIPCGIPWGMWSLYHGSLSNPTSSFSNRKWVPSKYSTCQAYLSFCFHRTNWRQILTSLWNIHCGSSPPLLIKQEIEYR